SSPSRARRASRPSSFSALTTTSPSEASSSTTRISGRRRRVATASPSGDARTDARECNERASLQTDLLREAVPIADDDVAPPDLDDLASLEVSEHPVHRHT